MPTKQMRALWHPTRARILELLMAGPATQSEIIAAAGGPPAKVVYHSRVLCRAGSVQYAESSGPEADDPVFEVA